MKPKRFVVFGLAGVFLLGIAVATVYFSAKYFTHDRQNMSSGVIDTASLIQKMDLSSEQKAKLEPMEASLQKDLNELQVKLAQERMALCELLGKDVTDPEKLDGYVNRVAALEAEQQRRVVQHLAAMRGMLNPEQKKNFFSSLMQAICQGCRATGSGQKCLCGLCEFKKET
ncbi:MAG: periplasmic heavy metal sensor [Elusimicrobia bacterium]|jgi:Spy/CpxP family protein refolding chaperone|nr:periplasmic heavy metal sensor [Elusimicrobiota bacterium]